MELKELINQHLEATGSARAREILDNFDVYLPKFKRIIPHDYKKITAAILSFEEKGLTEEQAQIEAFYSVVNS